MPNWASSSPLRALQLFLKKNARLNRLPDYVVVEGRWPAATWPSAWTAGQERRDHHGRDRRLAQDAGARHSADPAGGIFTGSDAVRFMEMGGRPSRSRPASPSRANAACPTMSSR